MRAVRLICGFSLAAFIFAAPLAYWNYYTENVRNFRVMREGVLYRSGQLTLAGLKQVLHDYDIKTVVSLRDSTYSGKAPPDLSEEQYCREQDITYVRIPPRNWWAMDGSVPAEEGVNEFLGIMDDPKNYPVLIHCFAGIHRTGAYCAINRMEYDHWSNEAAIAEMVDCGYVTIWTDLDVRDYLETYKPRWKRPVETPSPPVSTKVNATPVKNVKKKGKKIPGRKQTSLAPAD